MITQIGIVSGEILSLLEKAQTPLSITQIKSHLAEDMDLIQMSVGWLIREGYICLVTKDAEKYVALISNEIFSSV